MTWPANAKPTPPCCKPRRLVSASSGEQLFAAAELNESDAMIELSRRLNLEIMRAAGGVRSCPAFAGCYNEELGTVCYVNAGHTPGLLRDDSSVVELPATGLPLGLFSLAPTDARIVGLGPNGSLAVVSRGVVEAESKHAEFGLDGVKSVMQAGPASAKRSFPAHPATRAGLHAHGSEAQRRDRTDAHTGKLVNSTALCDFDPEGYRTRSIGLHAACGVK